MEAYQDRVIAERNELSEKLDKLRTFNSSAFFLTLRTNEMNLLTRQALVMSEYLDILNARIHRWEAGF